MTNYIDIKYLNRISAQLQNFKRKNETLYNFRCPYCGDSQTDTKKARGYIFLKEGSYIFKCHNCGVGASIGNFIKHVDQNTYSEYALERFGSARQNDRLKPVQSSTLRFSKKRKWVKSMGDIKKVSQLPQNHPAKVYVDSREIPKSSQYKLYYAPKFFEWANTLSPNKFENTTYDEPRLVIPFIDQYENLIGFQGRALKKSKTKYITVMLEDTLKVYGLDTADFTKPVYVVEGPIDSLFVPNAIAMAGADVASLKEKYPQTEFVYIYDNEPRSKEITRRIEKQIRDGNSVVIFPKYMKEKDINDMVMSYDKEAILNVIYNNTYSGLVAMTKFIEWKIS